MLAGIVRPALRQAAIVAALTVFLAFPAGHLVGLAADGMPSPGILAALGLELAIAALADLGGGSVTFSDADIALVALEGTPQGRFDDVIGRLETSLPDVFALQAVLPEPADSSAATGSSATASKAMAA